MANHSAGFTALADPTRRAIFERLARSPSAVGELARELPVSRPAVSQHLKVLKSAWSWSPTTRQARAASTRWTPRGHDLAWSRRYEVRGLPVPVALAGPGAVPRLVRLRELPVPWPGQIILSGLAPLPAAEIRWGLFAHTQRERHTRWDAGGVQALVNTCRAAAPDR